MRILILNRRDICNPSGGGAEIYTHEIARGLVERHGCEVIVFACRYKDSIKKELVDGVRYVRKGNEFTVHLWGFLYAASHRKEFDLIIDEFNGIGFFTFILPNSAILIHQLYREFWLKELGFIGIIPYVIEPPFLWFYRGKPAITISPSTKTDLEHIGFKNVNIVMVAIKHIPERLLHHEKEANPTLVFLGRLRSTKRPVLAIEMFNRVKEKIPAVRLWIIGRGPDEKKLKKMAKGMDGITFFGWVDEERKTEALCRAHILLVPSVREGFGINVIEAASVGTPAIGYDVPGLRDSIQNNKTGYLVNSVEEAASRIMELINDQNSYNAMSKNCLNYSKDFDWAQRVDEFWHTIAHFKTAKPE